jgi:hypothetical protein
VEYGVESPLEGEGFLEQRTAMLLNRRLGAETDVLFQRNEMLVIGCFSYIQNVPERGKHDR